MAIYQLVQGISIFQQVVRPRQGTIHPVHKSYLHNVLSLAKNFTFSDLMDTLNGLAYLHLQQKKKMFREVVFIYSHKASKKQSHSLKLGFLSTSSSYSNYTIHLPKIYTQFLCPSFQPILSLARLILDNGGIRSKLSVKHPNAVLLHLPGGLPTHKVPAIISNWEAVCWIYPSSSVPQHQQAGAKALVDQ